MSNHRNIEQSPFHAGERYVQTQVGVRDIENWARKVVRPYLPEQHRGFHTALPFLVAAARDGYGRPWATLLSGPDGFVTSPDSRTLNIHARPAAGDALEDALVGGADIGILGIELATRRRNRVNGRMARDGVGGLVLAVEQAFGNCPQYIQSRDHTVLPDIDRIAEPRPVKELQRLDERARHIISRADTLFIASHLPGIGDTAGTDISHRGGKPGFVRIDGDGLLTMPDFPGNQFFNTLGNVHLNPKVGLLFIDFRTRGLLSMTGHAEIVWKGEEVQLYSGAERLIKFRLDKAILWERTVPIRWRFRGWSRSLDRTGSW